MRELNRFILKTLSSSHLRFEDGNKFIIRPNLTQDDDSSITWLIKLTNDNDIVISNYFISLINMSIGVAYAEPLRDIVEPIFEELFEYKTD